MELVEIVRGAQAAMDRGDYHLAAAACSHVLEAFPACLTAHRLLGEAYLEQGDVDAAIEHFDRTIQADPLNVVARLGLGVANEEKRRMEEAYASYLHAWEINPALDQVRDELVRLRGLLNGDERLHPTRSGLAGIYERSGQFGRAAAEWRAVLASDPENTRARTAIAEVLWRSGDDGGAAAACREALTREPDNARALALLADIETRRGTNVASDLASRYQTIDPSGEIAAVLAEWRGDLAIDALRREHVSLPDFDFSAPPVDRLAPPAKPGTGAVAGLVSSQFAAPDLWDNLVQDLRVDGGSSFGGASVADDVQPFSWIDEGAAPSSDSFSAEALLESRPAPVPAAVAPTPAAVTAPFAAQMNATASLEDQIAAMSGATVPLAPFEASAPAPMMAGLSAAAATAPFAMSEAELFGSVPPAAEPPRAPQQPPAMPPVVAAPPKAAEANPFVTADGRVDLTVGWDDLDRQLREATPSFDSSHEFDALAAELGVDGIVPFEMGDTGFDDLAWAPFTDDDLGGSAPAVQAVAPAPVAPAPVPPAIAPERFPETVPAPLAPQAVAPPVEPEVPSVAIDDPFAGVVPDGIEPFVFDEIPAVEAINLGDEIIEQIPAPRSSGYTELLRNMDSEEIPDYGIDEELNPFANPDAAGQPLEFEDLLAVTSKDGTAPLAPIVDGDAYPLTELPAPSATIDDGFVWPTDDGLAVEPSLDPLPARAADDIVMDDVLAELGDLQPFSLEDGHEQSREGTGSIDFSDINEAPFDPATLNGMVRPPVVPTTAADGWQEPEPAETTDSAAAEPAMNDWLDHQETPFAAFAAAPPPIEQPIKPARRESTNGLGIGANGVAWPTFVGQTSGLIDRTRDGENLFLRLRAAKQQGIAAGLYQVRRSLRPASQPIAEDQVQVVSIPAPQVRETPAPAPRPGLTEAERIDLMALRIRLIEDDSSAQEVASSLEAVIARGLHDALALRVLGEAYLRLGRHEQAAAQFRQAMLTRQRSRV